MYALTAMPLSDSPRTAAVSPSRVLLIAYDARLASFLDRALAAAGYQVERAVDGTRAFAALEARTPDIVLVDLGPPGLTQGLELVRRLRARLGVPILLAADDDALEDRVAGLDAGADDYLVKPFALEELLARMRALLRGRALATATAVADTRHGVLAYADVRLDQDTYEVWRGERRLELRRKAFELLAYFLCHPQRVLSRRQLLERVWGYEFLGDSNVIDVTISHLRRALESGGEPRLIHTVRRTGYILSMRGSVAAAAAASS
jgi:two-component system response regulator MprA